MIHIQCVYASSQIRHMRDCFIPLLRRTTKKPIRLLTINFDPDSHERLVSGYINDVEVIDVPNPSKTKTGFAENHNILFMQHCPEEAFVIINPDCIPQEGSIDRLLERKNNSATKAPVGIVEGRQWPFEHPKEYDSKTLQTPWASGAFALIDADFYAAVGGMDELYFLYLEDVDLSWQAWLNGYTVLYEPTAFVTHFTGGRFYRDDLIYNEQYFSLRNFLIIARKFFGEAGEKRALKMLKSFPHKELSNSAIQEYLDLFQQRITKRYETRKHPNIKILDVNCFHRMRS